MLEPENGPVAVDSPVVRPAGPLGIDPEELNTCVSCGLCLPHCPTFRVTGEEAYSPRGRIDAMRGVEWEGGPVDEQFVDFMETCVQCRGCEPACPSGVPFGSLMEQTRTALATERTMTPWWQRLGLRALAMPRLVLAGSTALALAQRARLVPRRIGLGRLPLRRGPALAATGDDAWLFTGCVMDAWQRSTHRSLAALLSAAGVGYRTPGRGGGCCGALHTHAGLTGEAATLAERVMASMPGEAPIIVDSAGCGAALKEYGHLLGTDEAAAFASRVVDASEWLATHLDALPEPTGERPVVIVQDPCHLRHVQRVHDSVRTVLEPVADLIELDDDGLCCGAGGAFSALQPDLAGQIRERKMAAIDRAIARAQGEVVVASANPGCSMHLERLVAERGVPVRHPVDIVADAVGLER